MPNNFQTDKTPDFYESVYERLSQSIYDILPNLCAAQPGLRDHSGRGAWSERELRWDRLTFKRDPNLMWSDGNPVHCQ